MVLGVVGPEMAMDFGSKKVEPRLRRGLSTDSPHTIFGLLKTVPVCLVGPKASMFYLHKIFLK